MNRAVPLSVDVLDVIESLVKIGSRLCNFDSPKSARTGAPFSAMKILL